MAHDDAIIVAGATGQVGLSCEPSSDTLPEEDGERRKVCTVDESGHAVCMQFLRRVVDQLAASFSLMFFVAVVTSNVVLAKGMTF